MGEGAEDVTGGFCLPGVEDDDDRRSESSSFYGDSDDSILSSTTSSDLADDATYSSPSSSSMSSNASQFDPNQFSFDLSLLVAELPVKWVYWSVDLHLVESSVSLVSAKQTVPCFSSLWGWDCQTCRRGLSRYFEGKSESFRSLSDVRCIEDLVKKETPSRKRLKASGDCGFNSTQKRCRKSRFHGGTISKKTSKGSSVFSLARRNRNGALPSSKMPSQLPLHENLQWRCTICLHLHYKISLDKRKFILVRDHFFLSFFLSQNNETFLYVESQTDQNRKTKKKQKNYW